MTRDEIKCFACSIGIEHTEKLHNDYLEIWCEKHHSWCGDHTQRTIEAALRNMRSAREEAAYRVIKNENKEKSSRQQSK